MMQFVTAVILILHSPLASVAYNINNNSNHNHNNSNKISSNQNSKDRRAFLSIAAIQLPLAILTTTPLAAPQPSAAFDNRLDDRYTDRTAQTGVRPDNLGVKSRTSSTSSKPSSPQEGYQGLAPCDGRPNCWCSSTPFEDNPARYIQPWDSTNSRAGAAAKPIQDLKKVIDTYEVGQTNIDGGGFQIIEYDEARGYLYVNFQSYKNGFIDDVEFWYNVDKDKFDVRSASRIGQSDLGVNAKRLEYIGGRLEKEFGWKLNRRKNGSLV